MPDTRSSYDGRTINTTMQREPVNIGAPPDFWAILDEVQRRAPVAPRRLGIGSAMTQAGALRGPAQQGMHQGGGPVDLGYEGYFGTLTYPYGSAGFYQPYMPGMNLGTGQQPVAMGYRRGGGRR